MKETNLNPIYFFIKPPCIVTLERRLRTRGTETEESLQKRLSSARTELEYVSAERDAFDFIIVNDDLENAYELLKTYLSAVRLLS